MATVPSIAALTSVLLLAKLAISSTRQYLFAVCGASASVLLASALLGVSRMALHLEIIPVKKTRGEASLAATLVMVGAVAALFVASSLLPTSRLCVVLVGLYVNQWNAFTPLALFADVYWCYSQSEGLVDTTVGYTLTVLAGAVLLRRTYSVSQALNSLHDAVLVGVMVGAIFGSVVGSVSWVMVAVNVAASAVLIVLLPHSYLRVVSPAHTAYVSLVIEYLVVGPMRSVLYYLFQLVAPLTIKPDRSHLIAKEEVIHEAQAPSSILTELTSHKDTRAIFHFLLLNTTFMFVQLLYSFRSKSLGLLSDSLHMALDCTSLALGLVAGILSKLPIDSSSKFPFGLKHFEILAGFTNGTLLIGISGSIIIEAIGRLYHPVLLQKTTELIVVSVLGLVVNLVGILAFNHGHEGHSHGHSHSHGSHSHSHTSDCEEGMNDNMRGIFLHILADTLGSVGVVVSTLLIKFFNWEGFDPIASIIIAVLIFGSAVPLVQLTASTLLLKLDTNKETKLRAVLNDITTVKGVKTFTTPRFWPSHDDYDLNGYVHIQIYRGENGGYIKRQCERVFQASNINAMIQVENDFDDCWCRK